MRASSSGSAPACSTCSRLSRAIRSSRALLVGPGLARDGFQVVDGVRTRLEPGPLVGAGQKTARPVERVSLGQAASLGVGHDDEAGQVFVLRAESVSDPGADRRKAHARQAGVHHEQGRTVVVRLTVERVQERPSGPRAAARHGKMLETHLPHWPCWRKANGDFIRGPTSLMKKPVCRSKPGSCLPSSGPGPACNPRYPPGSARR